MIWATAIPFMDQPNPVTSWVLAGVAVVLIGIAKSGFGSGVGILAVPLFVYAFGRAEAAVGALLPLLIAADVLSVWHHWGTWDRRNLRVLAPGTVVGILLGLGMLYWLMGMPPLWWMGGEVAEPFRAAPEGARVGTAQRNMEIAIGAICLLYVAADRVKARFAPEWHVRANYGGGTITGVSAGVVTAIAHAAGPIATIYLLGQHIAKQKFIGTAVIYFFAVNLFKVPFYVLLGLIHPGTLWAGLWLLPAVPVGTWLGVRLNRWMDEGFFRGTILLIVLLSGLQLVTGWNPVG